MNNMLIKEIDRRIEQSRERLAKLTTLLVNIKSVEEKAESGAPFGKGPRKVLDKVLELGQIEGFYCDDYGVGVVSLALESGEKDLGIWLHGDVVPEGEGWKFEPYNATEYSGCIIGRGAADNKGQLASIFILLSIFKELGIKLSYNPALFVGSNEETGMGDIKGVSGNNDAKGFLNVARPPRLSLVPDGGFSVGYGGKGGLILKLKSKTPLHNLKFTAGQTKTPGLATAVFEKEFLCGEISDCSIAGRTLSAQTPPCHSAHPSPDGNMITLVANAILENNLYDERDKKIFEFLRYVTTHTGGDIFGIETKSDIMGALTVCAVSVDDVDSFPELTLNIRYPIEITAEEIIERVNENSLKYGFEVSLVKIGTLAYLTEKDNSVVNALCKASAEVIGEDIKPYTMGGSTYANYLPNAYVYGMSSNMPPADFPSGRGGAHGIDEAVSLDRLQRAMKIYARALLSLDEIEW